MVELEEFEFRRRYEMERASAKKPLAWSDVPLEAVKSFGPSVANMVGDIYQAVTSQYSFQDHPTRQQFLIGFGS